MLPLVVPQLYSWLPLCPFHADAYARPAAYVTVFGTLAVADGGLVYTGCRLIFGKRGRGFGG